MPIPEEISKLFVKHNALYNSLKSNNIKCYICGKKDIEYGFMIDCDVDIGFPLYWKIVNDQKLYFCDAYCSLKFHEENQKKDNSTEE